MVDRRLALDIDLFNRGGMRILHKIERQDYNVLAVRPSISKVERVGLLFGAVARAAFSKAPQPKAIQAG
jgi:phytoene/squalene synthetase